MAIEAKRGCGYRKVGGLYLVASNKGRACGRLPIELKPCQTCGGGVRQTRGWTWIDPSALFADTHCFRSLYACDTCPMNSLDQLTKAGMLWVGKQHYVTPDDFMSEALKLGISRRIPAVPRGFKVGEHWVFLAHPEVVPSDEGPLPAVFQIFRPERIEKVVTETESNDEDAMGALRARGITPFVVPDDDQDHQ